MTDIFVSPNGNGRGTQTDPYSIDQAQALVKAACVNMSEDINLYLVDGLYSMSQPIVIQADSSGSNGFFVRWRNTEGATPVFSGAVPVTGWDLHDEAKNIWKAQVTAGSDFEHLWQGHKRLTRAWSGWKPKGFKSSRLGLKMTKGAPDVASWKNPQDIVVTKLFMWRHIPAKVQRIVGKEIQLDPAELATYKVPSTALGVMEPVSLYMVLNFLTIRLARYFIENAYELLTDEGEWYLDKQASVLYFKPFAHDSFSRDSVLLYSRLKTFFKLDGSPENPINNVAIQGIHFCYGKGSKMGVTAGFPTEPTKAITPTPEAAVQVNAGHNIIVQNNYFMHMGYDALHFDLQGSNIQITGNGFGDISRSAISLSQTNLLVSNKSKKGILPENKNKFFDGVAIRNNYIRDVGLDSLAAGITYSEFARNVNCTHNEIRGTTINAIRNSWRYLGWHGHAGNIEYSWNKTSDVVLSGLDDFGALYVACSNDGYTKIHHNYIDGVGASPNNAGIYLDVFVDHGEIYNNLSVNMPQPLWYHRISRAWVAIVMSTNTKTHNNWSDVLTYRDFDQGRLRFFWPDKSNTVYDNELIQADRTLPAEAQEVAEKAGLEFAYRPMRSVVNDLLESQHKLAPEA